MILKIGLLSKLLSAFTPSPAPAAEPVIMTETLVCRNGPYSRDSQTCIILTHYPGSVATVVVAVTVATTAFNVAGNPWYVDCNYIAG